MKDNLNELKKELDLKINSSLGIGEIKADYHNEIITDFMRKSGKYSGLPYIATGKIQGNIPTGVLSFNGSGMDENFFLMLSEKTADFNLINPIIETINIGSILHFKDFSGRSSLFRILQIEELEESFVLELESQIGNNNYMYNPNDMDICIIEFFNKIESKSQKIKIDSIDYSFTSIRDGIPDKPQKYDRASGGVKTINEDGQKIEVFVDLSYKGTGDPNNSVNWWIISQVELT